MKYGIYQRKLRNVNRSITEYDQSGALGLGGVIGYSYDAAHIFLPKNSQRTTYQRRTQEIPSPQLSQRRPSHNLFNP